jgi:hypothetical protein
MSLIPENGIRFMRPWKAVASGVRVTLKFFAFYRVFLQQADQGELMVDHRGYIGVLIIVRVVS